MMNKTRIAALSVAFIMCFAAISGLSAWGFWAHKRINRIAVFTLPSRMAPFYLKHINYLTEHSIDADKRRSHDKEEGPRHYIDIDHYGQHPFDSMPQAWEAAVAKYSKDTLIAWGVNPWHIQEITGLLTEAFKAGDKDKILFFSSELGHYIGDAHVPLHTTINHDGQLTNQKGLHSFWESRLPELFANSYNYKFDEAAYLEDPLASAWDIIRTSHIAVDSVLSLDRDLNSSYPQEQKYIQKKRGERTVSLHSEDYAGKYHQMLSGMVERRMKAAITSVGSFWYTAWVNAGKPDLSKIDNIKLPRKEKKALKKERKLWESDAHKAAALSKY
jgi:hypothetical protein